MRLLLEEFKQTNEASFSGKEHYSIITISGSPVKTFAKKSDALRYIKANGLELTSDSSIVPPVDEYEEYIVYTIVQSNYQTRKDEILAIYTKKKDAERIIDQDDGNNGTITIKPVIYGYFFVKDKPISDRQKQLAQDD